MNAERRPRAAFPYSASGADDAQILLLDPQVQTLVAYAAAVAREMSFQEGFGQGYRHAETDMARAWQSATAPVRDTLRQPTFDELQHRRYGQRRPDRVRLAEAS